MTEQLDRHHGALVGLAIGDALGAPLEFSQRDVLPPLTGMQSGGKFELETGQWTDDTSMALCLAVSLIETRSFDLRDQLNRFLKWRDEGYLTSTGECFGIGQQTFWALNDFQRTDIVARDSAGKWRSGNGSLMRLAPVPMVFADNLELVAATSAASSLTTHPLDECAEACAAFGQLIAGAIQGWSREQILAEAQSIATSVSTEAVRSVLAGSYLNKSRDEISSSGYVVDTMEAALWAFAQADDFAHGALLAVNLGHDSDTVGAVYGQLAGAYFGMSGIPAEWREQLHDIDMIVDSADRLLALDSTVRISEESIPFIVNARETSHVGQE